MGEVYYLKYGNTYFYPKPATGSGSASLAGSRSAPPCRRGGAGTAATLRRTLYGSTATTRTSTTALRKKNPIHPRSR